MSKDIAVLVFFIWHRHLQKIIIAIELIYNPCSSVRTNKVEFALITALLVHYVFENLKYTTFSCSATTDEAI